MATHPPRFRRALLALGLGLAALAGVRGADEPPATPPPPLPTPDFAAMSHSAMAERMGFSGRIRGMIRGRPLEEDRYHRGPPDRSGDRNASEYDAWSRNTELGEGREQAYVQAAPLESDEARGFGPPGVDDAESYDEDDAGEGYLEDLESPADVDQLLADVDAMIAAEGLDGRPELYQSLELGFLDTEFSSAADGSSTTDSRYLRHQAEYRRGLGPRSELRLLSDLTVDKLRNRAALTGNWTRQVERQGEVSVRIGGGLQDSKEGEAEPDHDFYDWQVRGSRVTEEGLNWAAQVYGDGTSYDGQDPFYLDFNRQGAQVEGQVEERGLRVAGRHVYERDRFRAAPTNDVDRNVSELGLGARLAGVDLTYTSVYQREGVVMPGDLDAYRQWTTSGAASLPVGERLLFDFGLSKQSRTVDQVSFFLFDSQQYSDYQSVTAFFGASFSLGLTRSELRVRNRRKNPLFDETRDDRDEQDYELSATYLGDRLEAAASLYGGRVRHLAAESEAFANYDRSGYSLALGWRLGRQYRADLNHSFDEEKYPTFVINENRTRTSGASLTYTF